MRRFILIAAMVLASASAQAGETRSLTTGDSLTTVGANTGQSSAQEPKATNSVRADNDAPTTSAPQAVDTPRANDAPAAPETPRYTTRPAAVGATTLKTTTTTTTQRPYDDTMQPTGHVRHARADWPHGYGRWTTRRVIAMLHRYGVYW
jgi:hypothetical protein